MVISASATSISLSRALPAGSRSAPWRLKDVDGLGEIAVHGAGERVGFLGGGVALDGVPQCFIQDEAGIERADLGLDGVVGGAQLGRGGDAFQMPDHAHRVVELFGHGVEGVQRVGRWRWCASRLFWARTSSSSMAGSTSEAWILSKGMRKEISSSGFIESFRVAGKCDTQCRWTNSLPYLNFSKKHGGVRCSISSSIRRRWRFRLRWAGRFCSCLRARRCSNGIGSRCWRSLAWLWGFIVCEGGFLRNTGWRSASIGK